MKLENYLNSLETILHHTQLSQDEKYHQISALHKQIYSLKQLSKLSAVEIQQQLLNHHPANDEDAKYSTLFNEFLHEVILSENLFLNGKITLEKISQPLSSLVNRLQTIKVALYKLQNPEFYNDIKAYGDMLEEINVFASFLKFVTTLKSVFIIALNPKYPNYEQVCNQLNALFLDIHEQFKIAESITETNMAELPLEFTIEPKKDTVPENDQYYGKPEHIEIVNKGFTNFINRVDDPSGCDFFNFISLVGEYEELPGSESKGLKIKFPIENNGRQYLGLRPGHIALLPAVFPAKSGPISFKNPDDLNIFNQNLDSYKKMALQKFYDGISKPEEGINPLLHYKRLIDAIHFKGRMVKNEGINLRRENAESAIFKLVKNKNENPDDFCHGHLNQQFADNFDHYQDEALEMFRLSLSLAISKAATAKLLSSGSGEDALLTEAIINALYACHFLVDYFLSGHHVPKKELLNAITNKPLETLPDLEKIPSTSKVIAAFLANTMHDENSEQGIFKGNQKENWGLYENDRSMYNNKNAQNFKIAAECVTLALNDIYLTFTGNPKNKPLFIENYQSWIPQDLPNYPKIVNMQPLFKLSKDKTTLKMRKANHYEPLQIVNPANLLTLLSQFAKIKIRNEGEAMHEANKEEMEKLLNAGESFKFTII